MTKKRISLLLALCLLLSLLPLPAVAANSADTSTVLNDYVTISEVQVGSQNTTRSGADGSYTFTADTAPTATDNKVSINFKAQFQKEAVGLYIKRNSQTITSGTDYTFSGDTYTVNCDVSTSSQQSDGSSTDNNISVTLGLQAVKADGSTLGDEKTITVVFPKKTEQPATHSITTGVSPANSGTVKTQVDSADVTSAATGAQVTVIATPGEGYEGGTVEVKNGSETVSVTDNKTFTMPDADVTVTVTFTMMYAVKGGHEIHLIQHSGLLVCGE